MHTTAVRLIHSVYMTTFPICNVLCSLVCLAEMACCLDPRLEADVTEIAAAGA